MNVETESAGGTWEGEAERWVRWTRTPGHDVFPYFWPAFVREILPADLGRALEVGCGEGRVVRELARMGHRVVGLDAAPTLVRAAQRADVGGATADAVAGAAAGTVAGAGSGAAYLIGDGTRLPFADASFDTVVAYNGLQTMQDADDMAATVGEIGRVVRPGGWLCACVAHPMTDVARLSDASDGIVRVDGSYFERQRVDDAVTQDGLSMTFRGWTNTLEDYARAIEAAGFAIERLREPRPTDAQVAARPSLAKWGRLPLFLMVRGVRG
jgi:SAM-dependent methyltransferase